MKELPMIWGVFGKMLYADIAFKLPAALITAVVGYALPTPSMQSAALATMFLIVLDTITGVVAARLCGKIITSAKMGRVLVKILAYGSVVAVVSVVTKTVPGVDGAQGASVTGVLTFIVLTEGVSVLENVKLMGFELPFGLEAWFQERIHPRCEEKPKP